MARLSFLSPFNQALSQPTQGNALIHPQIGVLTKRLTGSFQVLTFGMDHPPNGFEVLCAFRVSFVYFVVFVVKMRGKYDRSAGYRS